MGFRVSDQPNVTADPIDGTLYAVWVAYRDPNVSMPDRKKTAGVYLSRGTPDAMSWTAPIIINGDYPDRYQFMPWVQVSRDHVVHVTYGAAILGGNGTTQVAAFYTQSMNRGASFSTPPWILNNSAGFLAASFMGDYQATSIGGYTSNSGTIMAAWTDTSGVIGTPNPVGTITPDPERAASFGTFNPCGVGGNYAITQSTGAGIVPGTNLVPNSRCNDGAMIVLLTSPYPSSIGSTTGNSLQPL